MSFFFFFLTIKLKQLKFKKLTTFKRALYNKKVHFCINMNPEATKKGSKHWYDSHLFSSRALGNWPQGSMSSLLCVMTSWDWP